MLYPLKDSCDSFFPPYNSLFSNITSEKGFDMSRIVCLGLLLALWSTRNRLSTAAVASTSTPTWPQKGQRNSMANQDQEPSVTLSRWDLKSFHAFVKGRTGGICSAPVSLPTANVYWVLHGQLSNPFTGDVIAEVRGIEVVRFVGYVQAPGQQRGNICGSHPAVDLPKSQSHAMPGTRMCLQLKDSQPKVTETGEEKRHADIQTASLQRWCALATSVSAKTFRYFEPCTGRPLLRFRPGPRAKVRTVPAAITTKQVITYALSHSGSLHLVAESLNGGLVAVQNEAAGPVLGSQKRKCILCFPPKPPKKFELSLLMWPGSKRGNRDYSRNEGNASEERKVDGSRRGFPWRSLVQFGTSSAQPACRELYALTTEPLPKQHGRRPRMKYLRYGEAPHWCGAGRVCHLALDGTRYDRLQDVPKRYRQLFFPTMTTAPLTDESEKNLSAELPPQSVEAFLEEARGVQRAERARFHFRRFVREFGRRR